MACKVGWTVPPHRAGELVSDWKPRRCPLVDGGHMSPAGTSVPKTHRDMAAVEKAVVVWWGRLPQLAVTLGISL